MIEIGITNNDNYKLLCEKIENLENIMEDGGMTSATGGSAVGGMGNVVNSQPSSLAGATIGTNWSDHGGLSGSGDVSVQYNMGTGGKNPTHKVPVMGYNHGARTGKKTRKKRLDMKALRNNFSKKQDYTNGQGDEKRKPKVMSFDDFQKMILIELKNEVYKRI